MGQFHTHPLSASLPTRLKSGSCLWRSCQVTLAF
jgi:hypothetical protein